MSTPVSTVDVDPFWVSAFLDLEAATFDRSVSFWAAITGYAVSPPRGEDGEFATLVPPAGDDFLRVQRRAEGGPRLHLDLHVADPQAAADRAESLGARIVVRHEFGYVVLESPAGLRFCFVSHPASERPPTASWPGVASRVDQVSLDLPPSVHDEERAFWAAVTGWTLSPASFPEMTRLRGPGNQALQFLVQRLHDEGDGRATAHLDLATTGVAAEVERHLSSGAVRLRDGSVFVVMTDPGGLVYCVTPRDPGP